MAAEPAGANKGAEFQASRAVAPLTTGADNGLLDVIDVFSFHSYSEPQAMVGLIRSYREMMRDESNLFSVNVFNFSHEPVDIAPRLVLPEGMRILEVPSRTAQSIAPRSEMELTWKLDRAACPVARYDVRLLDPKHPVSGVSVPFLNPTGLRAESFDFMNVKRWRHIDPAKTGLYKMIRVGMCPTAVQIDYWMRNLVVYYSK